MATPTANDKQPVTPTQVIPENLVNFNNSDITNLTTNQPECYRYVCWM